MASPASPASRTSRTASASRAQHIPALDGLRGIAILSVMSFHYMAASGFAAGSFAARKLVGVATCMWSGVDLFFVLSGFLITGILLRAKDKPGYFTNFYMRRFLRIFPLYYAALVVLFLVVPHFVAIDTPGVQRIYDAQGWLWGYSEDIAITVHNEDYFDVDWFWVGHFWSLAVEEHFYLVWPLLVFVCSPRALLVTTLCLILATPLLRFAMLAYQMTPAAVYTLTVCRIDELAVGGLIALLARDWSWARMGRLARWGLLAACAYLIVVTLVARKPFIWETTRALGLGFSALAVGFGALVVFAIAPERNAVRRLAESRVLGWFGKYSYGAYVIHTPIQPLYLRLFPPQRLHTLALGLGRTGSELVAVLGFAALGIAITMLLALASFHLYERPFLKLKRYFEYGAPVGGTVVAPPS